MRILKLAFLATYISVSVASAQEHKPFGMSMGMSKQEVSEGLKGAKIVEIKGSSFVSNAAIESSPFFTTYVYTVTPETGLCQVTGYSKGFPGVSLVMEHYQLVKKALISKYGQASTSVADNVHTTLPIADAIEQGVTRITDVWGMKPGKNGKIQVIPVSDTLRYILIEVSRLDQNKVSVGLTYTFKNFEKCNETIIKNNAKGL